MPSECVDDLFELAANDSRDARPRNVVGRLYRSNWIDRSNIKIAVLRRLDDDVARQHRTNFFLDQQRLMRQLRFAGSKDT